MSSWDIADLIAAPKAFFLWLGIRYEIVASKPFAGGRNLVTFTVRYYPRHYSPFWTLAALWYVGIKRNPGVITYDRNNPPPAGAEYIAERHIISTKAFPSLAESMMSIYSTYWRQV